MEKVISDCIECSEPFEYRKGKVYCSRKCSNKAYRRDNKERLKEIALTHRHKVEQAMLSRARHRAKTGGLLFNITLDDIIVPLVCPVLGIPLFIEPGTGTNRPNSPSLDKIYPDKGYTKGNVRVISTRANLLKSDGTLEEMRKVLKDLECRD